MKNTKEQQAAIRKYMAALKRRSRALTPRCFPKLDHQLRSTAEYVRYYYEENGLGTLPYSNLSTAPTLWREECDTEEKEAA